jgi:carbonic anhydrase
MQIFPAELIDGYRNFMSGRYAAERERYHTLAESGQKPKTLIIACCDSRSSPETIFDAGPGELFVLRNIANLVPPYEPDGRGHGTSAAIEFAVQALNVENIVVMGHGRCGGIKAALDENFEPLAPGDFIGQWMSYLKPTAEDMVRYDALTSSERQTALERISIRNSIGNLREFPYVAEREAAGQITLHGAWFDISTGELWCMDPETLDFYRPQID